MSTVFWTSKTPVPAGRKLPGVAQVGSGSYVMGGAGTGSIWYDTNYLYDTVKDSWITSKANLPTTLSDFACVSDNTTYIYAISGFTGGVGVNTVYRYNVATNSWATRAVIPQIRYSAGVAYDPVAGDIYVIGGSGNSIVYNTDNQRYTPSSNSWAARASMPTARKALGAAYVNGKIYAIGGVISGGNIVSVVEEYNISTNSWATKASLPAVRRSFFCFVIGGKIYVVGGQNGSGTVVNTVFEYTPGSDSWATLTPAMTAARAYGHAAVYNDKAYLFTGLNSALGIVTTNDEFALTGVVSDTTTIASIAQVTAGVPESTTITSSAMTIVTSSVTMSSTALIGESILADAVIIKTFDTTIVSNASVWRNAYIPIVAPAVFSGLSTALGTFLMGQANIFSTAISNSGSKGIVLYSNRNTTSAETVVVDIITSSANSLYVLDLNSVHPPFGYQNYDWAYDWVVRTYNQAHCRFEARSADTLGELTSALFTTIAQGQILPRGDIKRYHQWRAHIWASGSGDFELHQFTIKGYVDFPAYPHTRTLTPQIKTSISSITLGTPVDQPDIVL